MRALVLGLALLAALKIWVQDSLYRSATEEALISAYRVRAAEACAAKPAPGIERSVDWTIGPQPRIIIGNPAVPVRIWQFEHEQWNARFRQPYIVLSGSSAGLSCAYDLLTGTAAITRS